jgi:hypothetical protein
VRQRLYGVAGDTVDELTEPIRRQGKSAWRWQGVHPFHDESVMSGGGDELIDLARTNRRR